MNLDAYKKTNLNGAHNSLVDAKAQTDIFVSSQFMPYLDKKRAYRSISNIWSATEQSEMKKNLESIREVHEPWKELDLDSNSWQPPRRNQYVSAMKRYCRIVCSTWNY